MIEKDSFENTITVEFLDKKITKNLKVYQENFDIVLTDVSSFRELGKILN